MSIDILQQKKQEVAQSMFTDFKKELGFFQSTVLSFFDKKITQTIASDKQLGNSWTDTQLDMNFIEKMLLKLSPETSEKLFVFIKQNQEKLVQANTIEALENLKKWIVAPTEVLPENQQFPTPEQVAPWENSENISSNPDQDTSPQYTSSQDTSQADEQNPDHTKRNIGVGIATWAGLWLSAKAIGQVDKLRTAKKLKETADVDPKEFIKKFDDIAEGLRKEKMNPKLTAYQKKTIDKSIKEFQNISKQVDTWTMDAVAMLQKLDKKLPNSLFKNIHPADAKKIEALLSKDAKLAEAILSKTDNIAEIQTLFKANGIKNIGEDTIKIFKNMDTIEDLHGAIFVCTKTTGIKALKRGLRWVMILDLIFTWVDIWILLEWLDEAKAYEKINQLRASTAREHKRVQFWASLSLTALSMIVTYSSLGALWWPLGFLLGLGLWAASFAVTQAIDVYYDAVEFYQQNKEDFKKQYRTEIKQAIIQSAATDEWNLNINSKLTAEARNGNKKLNTTSDAWYALIWQEEYQKFPLIKQWFNSDKLDDEFVKTLDASQQTEFKKQKQELETIIAKRMEYIQTYLYQKKWTPMYAAFVSAMKNNLWIKAIENILTESKMYYTLGLTWPEQYITGAKTIPEYKKLFWKKLQSESPEGFATLEKMWATQPAMIFELYQWVKNTESMFANSWESPDYIYADKVADMKKNQELIKRYYEYKSLDLSLEQKRWFDISFRALDAVMIEKILIRGDFQNIGASSRNSTEAKTYFVHDLSQERRDTKIESSDKVGQNIIYRIAKEIHGYEGNNTMSELIDFFREDKADALWIYYKSGRVINNDNAIDKKFSIEEMEAMSSPEIMKMFVDPSLWNKIIDPTNRIKFWVFSLPWMFISWSLLNLDSVDWLDTKADAGDMDKKMNNEYYSRLAKIVYEEKAYTHPEVQKKVETAIVDYITRCSQPVKTIDDQRNETQESWYIEMPYYLIMAAKKAHIGNIEKFLFKKQNNQIFACTSRLFVNEPLHFTQTTIQKQFVDLGTQVDYKQAMPYVTYVDKAKEKFETLMNFDDNELDIPEEYRKKYKDKINERNTFKFKLLQMDPGIAAEKLLAEYKTYYDWFDSMYTGMLYTISKCKMSNDLDSAQYLQQVEARANQLQSITIKNGLIVWPTQLLSPIQSKAFFALLTQWKPRGVSLMDMAKSPKEDDQNKAIWWVQQIVKSLLEVQVLNFDANGNLFGTIDIGEHKLYELALNNKKIIARLAINGDTKKYFTQPKLDIPKIDESKIKIVALQ